MRIKILVILVLVLILYLLVLYLRMQHLIRVGEELAYNAKVFEQKIDSPQARVLFLGDSSAVGTGALSAKESVAGYLGVDYPDVDIVNLGINGLKIAELAANMQKMDNDFYDLLVIQIGGNDIVRRTDLDVVRSSLLVVLAEAKGMTDNLIIFHGGDVGTAKLLPWFLRWYFSYRTLLVRDIYLDLVKGEGMNYIDMYRRKNIDPFRRDPDSYYATDFFHPSSKGYADWYEQIKLKVDLDKILYN